ncbi:beta-N-acetylhexosaminidase [Portibacter lacus]|uniref:beta-N-acetylhexosaminidase n=1 Tax=Portibacter lacus TaxID=1099794 RepID=A0AA37SSJ9_9BACT|nr:family 20 glycosylhydrolase [Portibacter lacus]GLR18006.1 beta-hexosaminidase [Portibacter lacus]
MNAVLKLSLLLLIITLWACDNKTELPQEITVIPEPAEMTIRNGSFQLVSNTKIITSDEIEKQAALLLLSSFNGLSDDQVTNDTTKHNFVRFEIEKDIADEGYELEITPEMMSIKASKPSGFIYAIQTIRQLLPIESKELILPTLTIKDEPQYPWRGFMLDVSRHFFEKEYVLKTIDRMTYFKLNTLHLHLIDDQGWRIEIKKYPKLTEIGAFRVDQEDKPWDARLVNEPSEKGTYGGFYTQEDIKEIVQYASERGITVMPEIEMPAHVTSAIAAYPEFSCQEIPVGVPSGGLWPITDIYCPGKESTFQFLEDVLNEVMELFPSKYIHVGGDEATKTNWEKCKDCQKRMAIEGLDDTAELQSYFIKRMERFLSSKGRILIGWDEILEGGLAPGATVMSWRGTKGGWEASEQGHDVVMTPGDYLYFNQYQGEPDYEPLAFGGYVPLSRVYSFEPMVDSMSAEQKKHVLGAQANLWSEFIVDEQISEYMIFPRIAALSEMVWTPKDKKSWDNFSKKIDPLFERLDHMGINYSKSVFAVTASSKYDTTSKELLVTLKNEIPSSEIRYSFNDEPLNASSLKYTSPISLKETTLIKTAVFKDNVALGDTLYKNLIFHKAFGKKMSYKPKYNKSYAGIGDLTLGNIIRGSKNFHDGQWLAWLDDEVEIIIDLEEKTEISAVRIGAMETQAAGIFYPINMIVSLSEDGSIYKKAGELKRPFKENGFPTIEDFEISFERQNTRYVKVMIQNIGSPPKGGGAFIFIDEIMVE